MPLLMLGQVVTELKLTSEEEVNRAMKFATDTGSPLGQAMVAQELISPNVLKACVQAQWMMRDKLITLDDCAQALILVQRRKWSFTDALLTLGLYCSDTRGMRLGEILKASGLLAPELVDKALERAGACCLPLGKAIVSFDFLEQATIDKVLDIQKQLRRDEIALPEAIEAAAKLKASTQALSKTSRILTRLLVDAEFVSVDDVQSYHTAAVTTGRSLGDLLSLYANLDPFKVFVLSSIARRIDASVLTYKDGTDLAKQFKQRCESDSMSLFEYKPGKISFYVYLRMLDYLDANKVQDLIAFLSANRAVLDQIIQAQSESLSPDAVQAMTMKGKVRACIESDDMLKSCLYAAFPADKARVTSALNLLSLVNSKCLKVEESLVWSDS